MKSSITLILLSAASPSFAATTTIAAWQATAGPGPLSAAHVVSGVSTASLSRGSGLIADVATPGFYDSYAWNPSASFPGIGSDDYLSFSVTFSSGYELVANALELSYSSASPSIAPRKLELRCSSDGFATTLFSDLSVAIFPGGDYNQINLSSLPGLSGNVEFRLWGYDSPGGLTDDPMAIFGLQNSSSIQEGVQNMAVRLTGDFTSVPEASFLFYPVLATICCLLRRRRATDGAAV